MFIAALALTATACSGTDEAAIADVPELPVVTFDELRSELNDSEVPVVVNVWASWCIPCRSEAPLLDRAASEFQDDIHLIGLNVRDDQVGARSFIAEFFPEAAIDHRFDRAGRVPVDLGGNSAVPLTFFFAPGGELVEVHTGVLDERTLALQIDELLASS